jgi:hypothetical protein
MLLSMLLISCSKREFGTFLDTKEAQSLSWWMSLLQLEKLNLFRTTTSKDPLFAPMLIRVLRETSELPWRHLDLARLTS